MSRRKFLVVIGLSGCLLAAPGATAAQRPSSVRHIGFLTVASLEADPRPELFRAGLRDLGYVEGKTIVIEWRSAQGNTARLNGLAEELVRLNVELLVASQTQAIQAAKRAAASIPIVFLATHDPVGSGFAHSLARPGGNLTGLSNNVADIGAKQVEMLALAVPNGMRIAILLNPTNVASRLLLGAVELAAQKADRKIVPLEARSRDEITRALEDAKRRADALIVQADGLFFQSRKTIAEFALEHILPTMFTQPENTAAGGMMSYGPNVGEHYYRAAYYVDRILKGALPGELPIEQPTKFEMVLNLRTAKALGLTMPPSLRVRADQVIE